MNREAHDDLLAAVIVNHDQWLAVVDQLACYHRDDPAAFCRVQWFVVNNGQDGVSPIAEQYSDRSIALAMNQVEVHQTPNLGYGAAVNFAAARTSRPFLLSLNADILPTRSFLASVLDAARRLEDDRTTRVGIVGFRLVNPDGTPQGSVGPFPTLARFLFGLMRPRSRRKYTDLAMTHSQTVDWVTGACMMLRGECMKSIGGFDERYFLYYEDVDVCLRARQSGWQVAFDPSAVCQHLFPYHGRRLTPRMAFVARRAILLYYWRHRPRWEFWLLSIIVRGECWIRGRNPAWRKIGEMVQQLLSDPDRHAICVDDLPCPRTAAGESENVE